MDKKALAAGIITILIAASPALAYWAAGEPAGPLPGEIERGREKMAGMVGYTATSGLEGLPPNCSGVQVERVGYGEEASGVIRVDCVIGVEAG